jgi:hypothetical protein
MVRNDAPFLKNTIFRSWKILLNWKKGCVWRLIFTLVLIYVGKYNLKNHLKVMILFVLLSKSSSWWMRGGEEGGRWGGERMFKSTIIGFPPTRKSALQMPSRNLLCPPGALQKSVMPSSLEGTALQTEKPELSAMVLFRLNKLIDWLIGNLHFVENFLPD